MLEKNGDDRPGSMQMVISALEEAQKLNETQRGHIWSVGHIPRQVALRLRRKSYTFYVICLVIGLSIVGYIRFGVKDKMREPTIIELKTPGIKVEEPAISPDGAWVAYVAEDTKGNRNICVASLDGNQIRQLTSDTAFLDPSGFTNRWGMGARNECPSFIGMTNQILYSSSGLELVSGDSTTNMGHWIGKDELRKIPVLGGSPSSVLADLSLPAVFSASPDGKWVAYLRNVRGHESLYYCGTDASDEKSVLDLPDSLQIMMKDLAWSPNSQSVALSAGKELILVEPFSGTTTSLPMGGYSISGVCWLTSKKLVLSAYSNEKADLYWVDRETAVPTRFTFGLGDYLHPRATIDGRKLVCLNRQHKHNLWSINAKTNEAKQITFEHHEVADASISFNGLRLSYRLDNRLILADRDGRNPSSILAQITGPIVSRAVWSHDDKYLAFSSRPGETFDSTDWRGIDDDLKNEQINTLEIATGIIRNAGKGRVVDWALGNRMILAQIDTSDDPRPDLYAVRSVESPGQDVMSFESYITPRFSPDAKNVLLGNESRTKLVKIDIETGKRTELWTSPDGGKIDGIQTVLMDGSTIIDRIMKDRPTKWEILRVMPGRQYASRILLLDSGYNYPTIATDLSFVIADKYSISSTVIMFDGFIP
jgi:Tol biopolymer transport system component